MPEIEVAGPPKAAVDTPASVQRAAAGAPFEAIWVNQLGGITFRVMDPERPRFIKWSPPNGPDLAAEAARLRWASAYITVPDVMETGHDRTGQWMVTAALPGESAVAEPWRSDPTTAARAIGMGLKELHERLPVGECPFAHWSARARLASLPADLPTQPTADRIVVCHGDPCAPNTLIGSSGQPVGHVDLGSLGVADRWADLAVATWSLEWNYGPGHEAELLDAYGVEPDTERTSYYRLLWEIAT